MITLNKISDLPRGKYRMAVGDILDKDKADYYFETVKPKIRMYFFLLTSEEKYAKMEEDNETEVLQLQDVPIRAAETL